MQYLFIITAEDFNTVTILFKKKKMLPFRKWYDSLLLKSSLDVLDVYYCTNIYKEIDRNNLNDKIISIQNIESIKEI